MVNKSIDQAPRRWSASRSSPVLGLSASSVEELSCPTRETGAIKEGEIRISHGWLVPSDLSDVDLLRHVQSFLPNDALYAAETAAAIYGIDIRPQSRFDQPFRLCVMRRGGSRAFRRPGLHCRSMQYDDADVHWYQGLRVTSPVRTVIDLLCSLRVDRAVWVLEEFLRRGLVSMRELLDRLPLWRGRRGVCTARRALRLADTSSESPQETAVRLRLLEAGFASVSSQLPVPRADGGVFRLDLALMIPQTAYWGKCPGVAVEYHGVDFHPSSGAKWQEDCVREQEIRAQGWQYVSVRADDLSGDEPVFERRVAECVARVTGQRFLVAMRRSWRLTRMNRLRNAWTRPSEPWWRLWRE